MLRRSISGKHFGKTAPGMKWSPNLNALGQGIRWLGRIMHAEPEQQE